MEAVRYEKKYLNEWEDFAASSNNGTIFHTRKFLSYHSPDKFKDHSLLFLEDKKIVALLTAAEFKKDGKLTLWSHMGASFGGFVYKETLGIRQAFDLTETLIAYCGRNNFEKIVITNIPIVYHKRYNEYLDFAFIKNGFNYLKREVTSVITFNVEEENVMKLIKPEARTSIRRAEKLGVVVKKSNDFEEYYEILKSNLAMRHNVQPAHTLDELLKLKELFPQKIQLYGAYLEKKMIAGVVNF
jgi:hypothetical protein